jgi:hypothetical protein
MRAKETSLIGIRLKHADRAKLQAVADKQHRALSNLIAKIAIDWLASQQSKPKHLNGNGHEHPKSASAV